MTTSGLVASEPFFEAAEPFLPKKASWKAVRVPEALTTTPAEGGRPEALSVHLSPSVSRELQEPSFKPVVCSNNVIFQMISLELGEAK